MKKKPKTTWAQYKELLPILKKCRADLTSAISEQVRSLKDPYLVRVRLSESRVKKLGSIRAKAKRNKIPAKEMFRKISDLVGIRIVCGNLEDIGRIRELLKGVDGLRIFPKREKDRIATPTEAGYRDLQVKAEYPAKLRGRTIRVPVEIQIRTMLQDSWAVLAHRDIYKEGAGLPEELKKLSRRLSDLLAVADGIAQDIREQVSRPASVGHRPKSRVISKEGLAFIFNRAFGRPPADYYLHIVAAACDEVGLTRLDALERTLMNVEWREKAKASFEATAKVPPEDEMLFEMAPLVWKRGINEADEIARESALDFVASLEFYQRELLSELPETYEEFVGSLKPVYKDDLSDFPDRIYRYAKALGVLRKCDNCLTPIVDEEEFEQAVQDHYGVEDDSGKIRNAVLDEAETGEVTEAGLLCSYHANVMAKD